MKAAEWIALVGALGLGAIAKTLLDRVLTRKDHKADLADKSIRIADIVVSLSESQLAKAQATIESLQREGEDLRAKLKATDRLDEIDSLGLVDAYREVDAANAEIA